MKELKKICFVIILLIILTVILSFLTSSHAISIKALTSSDNNTANNNPGDFLSAIDFVTKNDTIMSAIQSIWVTALILLCGKTFIVNLIKRGYHGQKDETSGLLYLGSFLAGLFLLMYATFTPMNFPWIYGGAFFLVIWLAQFTSKIRPDVSTLNRLIGLAGLIFAILFSWLFGIVIYNHGIQMTQHISLLFYSEIWSILATIVLLVGFVGILAILILLYSRSFSLLKEGARGTHFDLQQEQKNKLKQIYPLSHNCCICDKTISSKRGQEGWVCNNCGWSICQVHAQEHGFVASIGCPKCGGQLFLEWPSLLKEDE